MKSCRKTCPRPTRTADPEFPVPNFESKKGAKAEAKIRRNALLTSRLPEDRFYGRLLSGCKPDYPCRKPGCPTCMRSDRLATVEQIIVFLSEIDDLLFGTLILSDDAVAAGELATVSPKRLTDRLRQQLKRLGAKGPIIGWLEVDFDAEREVWQPHFHFIAQSSERAALHLLRKLYPQTQSVKRPVKLQPVTDRPRQISYCMKNYASRTIRFKSNGRVVRSTRACMATALRNGCGGALTKHSQTFCSCLASVDTGRNSDSAKQSSPNMATRRRDDVANFVNSSARENRLACTNAVLAKP